MKPLVLAAVLVLCAITAPAQPSLTIYNQQFAVIREVIPLDLRQGINAIQFTNATFHLEPDSVMLRDPAGRVPLRILEQNYRADPVSEGLLLSLFEGKELDFAVTNPATVEHRVVRGKVIRSGYVLVNRAAPAYGQSAIQPIIEMDGKLHFSLPGRPMFPALSSDAILKPTLDWRLEAGSAAKLDAELSYVTGGMSWKADYNMVAPETGDRLEMTGWITMDNQTGKEFPNARIKLVAGDVSKLESMQRNQFASAKDSLLAQMSLSRVTERTFDEYHLYTLPLPTTLRDRATKQVEFLRAPAVVSQRLYLYDGAKIDFRRYQGWDASSIRTQPEYGAESNPKVWVMREFDNNEANGLGVALPKGRVRFYRRDRDGALEFTGENNIDHTPRNEKVRVYTGDAFDITGERKRTNFQLGPNGRVLDESFEIQLRNRKTEAAEVRVVEHLYRSANWRVAAQSDPHRKMDSNRIEFVVRLDPNQEKMLTYTAHYSW